jgi:hypothetical protein
MQGRRSGDAKLDQEEPVVMNVVFMIYRRPELTAKVFSRIADARPQKLFVIADGPKRGDAGDSEKVERTRKIVENVDWPCEVLRNYSDVNLGCRKRVSSGLDWVFSQVEEAIILEDDCLPDPSFFPYCCELLGRYRNDERIMHVSGDNFQNGIKRTPYSYYFSKIPHCWGWATWRRAWRHYDVDMKQWPVFKESEAFHQICPGDKERECWAKIFADTYNGLVDTWDCAWTLSVWFNSGLAILPEINLVSNIGHGLDSTHTKDSKSPVASLATEQMGTIEHPPFVVRDLDADEFTFFKSGMFLPPSAWREWAKSHLLNWYWYGSIVRRIPVLGGVWVRWRK